MAIGNPITLTNNVSSRTITSTATAGQTLFVIPGGYRINQIFVFKNGIKLTSSQYQASDGSTVVLTSGASLGEVLEFQIFDDFRVANALDVNIGGNIGSSITINGSVTSNSFLGNLTGTATTALGLSGSPNIIVGIITATSAVVGSGITINSSGIRVTGVITATSFVGDGSGLTGAGSTVANDTTTNVAFYPLFTTQTTGTVTATKVSTSKLSFNPSTGTLTATTFSGSLSGNATSATSVTGTTSNGFGTRTVSTLAPSGGTNGDIWYKY